MDIRRKFVNVCKNEQIRVLGLRFEWKINRCRATPAFGGVTVAGDLNASVGEVLNHSVNIRKMLN